MRCSPSGMQCSTWMSVHWLKLKLKLSGLMIVFRKLSFYHSYISPSCWVVTYQGCDIIWVFSIVVAWTLSFNNSPYLFIRKSGFVYSWWTTVNVQISASRLVVRSWKRVYAVHHNLTRCSSHVCNLSTCKIWSKETFENRTQQIFTSILISDSV